MRPSVVFAILPLVLLTGRSISAELGISASHDIGATAASGFSYEAGGAVSVGGSGADIWKAADEFHYAYTSLLGDGEIIVRINSLTNTDPWAKAGPMIRESASPGSRFAMMVMTPAAQGAAFQYRLSTNGSAAPSNSGDLTSTVPRWLRLVRDGATVTGYHSLDGISWVRRSSVSISLPETILIGLAVTSHNDGTVATAEFDNLLIRGAQPDGNPPSPPSEITAVASGSSRVQLQWSPSIDEGGSGLASYRIFRESAGGPLANVVGTSYLDVGLAPETAYAYWITAIDGAGNESVPSAPAAVSTGPAAPPGGAPDWYWSIEPGTWKAIGENTMDSVSSERDLLLNPIFPSNAPWHGSVGLLGVIGAWNGGALASGYGSHGALLLYGGGRNNYLGSDVYAFDLGLQRWSRVTNPYKGPFTWPYPSTTYPDGSPVPPHTYDYVDYHPGSNSFVLLRGIADGKAVTNDTSVAVAHFLDLESGQWRTGATNPSKRQKSGGISCYDENRDLFWVIAPTDRTFSSFHPGVENPDGTFGRYDNYSSPEISIDGAADCSPELDLFVYTLFSVNKRVMARDLRSPATPAVQLQESGTPPDLKENKNGWAWSKRRGAFLYWRRGADLYEFRLAGGDWATGTWQWSRLTDEANAVVPQPMVKDNGVYSRFRIARYGDEEVALVVNQITGAVYAFRIP